MGNVQQLDARDICESQHFPTAGERRRRRRPAAAPSPHASVTLALPDIMARAMLRAQVEGSRAIANRRPELPP